MRRTRLLTHVLLGFTVSGAFINGTAAHAGESNRMMAAQPTGFEGLTAERQLLLDVYFAGRKLGTARALLTPGSLTFEDPEAVARLIPDVARLTQLIAGLRGPLPSNVALVCGPIRADGCGSLHPQPAGVIVDEERFRVELFVSPELLIMPDPSAPSYLGQPDDDPSLISLFGATLSGSSRDDHAWHVQNRSTAAVGNVRLRSDASFSSVSQLSIDNLTAETDRNDWRYTAGMFWAPGTDLLGRRRMIGIGASTQLDTRRDKTLLMGTPVLLFLQQPARVELLVDGRIAASRIYSAGHRLIDTANLPNGSYNLVLRITEDGRPARTEQRFFTKGSLMAPAGRPLFAGYAGLLSTTELGSSVNSRTFFYQGSAAYRLNPMIGVDATVLGTQHKAIFEGGLVWQTRIAQIRLAALVSSDADHGAVFRASSVGAGPISFSFDLRKIKSRDGRPLFPVSTSRGTFSEDPEVGFGDRGSYTQGLGIIGYRFGQANLRLSGLYRRNGSDKSSYSVGASLDLPVARSNRTDIVLQADVRKTERDVALFLGVRFLLNRGQVALSGSAGVSHQTDRQGHSNQLVGEAQLAWSRQLSDQSQFSTDAAIGRSVDGSYARGSAYARTPLLNGRADILHQFGNEATTQYAVTVDGGLVLARQGATFAGREMNDAAVAVSVSGGEEKQSFDVLVDEVVRATVTTGGRALVFLQPYENYDVRLRPRDAQIASFDTAPRSVTLYRGNVAELDWDVTPLIILFGRAIGTDRQPIALADVTGGFGVSRTDKDGYFQIEAGHKDALRLGSEAEPLCRIALTDLRQRNGFVSAGDLLCL